MIRDSLFRLRPIPQPRPPASEEQDQGSYFLNLDPPSENQLHFDQRKGDSPAARSRTITSSSAYSRTVTSSSHPSA